MSLLAIGATALVAGGLGFVGGNEYNKFADATTTSGSKKYGWLPDLPDIRDYIYSAPSISGTPPTAVNLNAGMGPVVDQGQLGSCTGNALSGAVLYELIKANRAKNDTADLLSRLFIYYNERAYEGTVKTDSGALIRDGIKMVAKYGVCKETVWPYVITKFATKPPTTAFKTAVADIIKKYSKLTTHDARISCLAAGYPFVAGFTVYSEFESAAVAQSGVVPLPGKGSTVVGGHAIVVIGYDNTKGVYICRNSWGAGWGQSGNFTIPFAYLDNTSLSDDHWVINA